jgi:hypothetical protein
LPCCNPAPNGIRELDPASAYVFVPNADFPSLRSVTWNVHAPDTPGTLNVGDNDVDTQPDGVTTAPVHNGTRSPAPVPAGRAANAVGSPAVPDAARSPPDDEHDDANRETATPMARSIDRIEREGIIIDLPYQLNRARPGLESPYRQ